MNFDIDNFLVQAYSRQFKELNKSTGSQCYTRLGSCLVKKIPVEQILF